MIVVATHILSSDESLRCTHCGQLLEPQEDISGRKVLLAVGSFFFFFWLFFTVLSWAMNSLPSETLAQFIANQFLFIWDLMHRLW